MLKTLFWNFFILQNIPLTSSYHIHNFVIIFNDCIYPLYAQIIIHLMNLILEVIFGISNLFFLLKIDLERTYLYKYLQGKALNVGLLGQKVRCHKF